MDGMLIVGLLMIVLSIAGVCYAVDLFMDGDSIWK